MSKPRKTSKQARIKEAEQIVINAASSPEFQQTIVDYYEALHRLNKSYGIDEYIIVALVPLPDVHPYISDVLLPQIGACRVQASDNDTYQNLCRPLGAELQRQAERLSSELDKYDDDEQPANQPTSTMFGSQKPALA